ncbi:MAG: CehA/McbA family metallohydrolase [Candidatus Brockarchaeota archaeon]|nr:CehA/McbA family metallohydrolase [Candidatus Brockarchaeota archaeon]
MVTKAVFSDPFSAPGRWFRGNLHAHTTNSDGVLSAKQMAFLYERSGYDFLAITDHGRLTDVRELSNSGFLAIPGEEISVGASEVGTAFHLLAVGIEEEVPAKEGDAGEDPQRVIGLAKDRGGEVILGHPYWSALSARDMLSLEGYLGIEVYNTSCFFSIAKGHSLSHWDELLARGRRPLGFATDDAHWHFNDHRPNDACGAWISVKAPELSLDAIMKSVREGLFYASNGPEIRDVKINGDEIQVETSSVSAISFVASLDLGERFAAVEGGAIASASYRLRGGERYVRIECTDSEGRSAWSNPIFFER